MQGKALVVLATMISFSSFAKVSFEEKLQKIDELESLGMSNTLNVDAYRRDLSYEQQGLNLESRARVEANLLASKIKGQILEAYKASLEDNQGDTRLAAEEVKSAILKDLELAAPEIKEELKSLSLSVIDEIERGSSTEVELKSTQEYLLSGVKARSEYLNTDSVQILKSTESTTKKIANKTEYDSKQEVILELVGEGSDMFTSGASTDVRSNVQTSSSADVSMQVKMEFLGVSVDAGPHISFKRDYSSVAIMTGEGLSPFLLHNGNFDFWKRDRSGNVVKSKGKEVHRNITFGCSVDLKFTTNYSGGGGFKVAGIGGGVKFSKTFTNSVNMSSRKIRLPEYVSGKSVTIKYLSELCHNDFMNAKVNKTMTIKTSLNQMMENVVSGLTFSHPETKCAEDVHCYDWFNKDIIALVKVKNFPRCVESREKFRSCQLRGLKGQNCAVIEKGKRTSDGMFEFPCDTGLKCVKTRSAGWFQNFEIYQHAKGSCQPINAKTYSEPGYYEIRFAK